MEGGKKETMIEVKGGREHEIRTKGTSRFL
jgi:hypothetical protein